MLVQQDAEARFLARLLLASSAMIVAVSRPINKHVK